MASGVRMSGLGGDWRLLLSALTVVTKARVEPYVKIVCVTRGVHPVVPNLRARVPIYSRENGWLELQDHVQIILGYLVVKPEVFQFRHGRGDLIQGEIEIAKNMATRTEQKQQSFHIVYTMLTFLHLVKDYCCV